MATHREDSDNGRVLPAVVITGSRDRRRLARLRRLLPAEVPCYVAGAAEAPGKGLRPLQTAAGSLPALAATLHETEPRRDWVVLDARLEIPQRLVERLARVAAADAALAAVSPLGNRLAAFNPLPPGFEPTPTPAPGELDRLAYLLGRRTWYAAATVDERCAWWRRDALEALARAAPGDDAARYLAGLNRRFAVADHVYVHDPQYAIAGAGEKHPPDPPQPLDALRHRLREALSGQAGPAQAAGLEPRPVLLHVVHSWGGGVERFCRDLIAADDARCHLVLAAAGDSGERSYGRVLRLHGGDPDAPVIREWRLPLPINSCEVAAPGYADVVAEILRDFSVDQVLVSSLIGHSLEVLETGLPTAVVLHDYFPVCPALNIFFGEVCRSCRRDRLDRCLAQNPFNRLFIDKDAEAWLSLRDAFVSRVLEGGVAFAVPTDSVREHLVAIEPRLAQARFSLIPHGLAPWSQARRLQAPQAGGRLRLVVPGRLKSGKGRELLLQALPALTGFAELWLVGCGKETGDFLGQRHVHLIFDYRRQRLPELLAMIRPHAGLLLSTVPETFGYTLSELWSLGLPVVATDLGAFSERVRNGENGLLAAPRAEAVVHAAKRLADDPQLLQSLWRGARETPVQDLDAMAGAYRELLPPPRVGPCRYPLRPPTPALLQEQALRADLHAAERTAARQRERLAAQERELLRRASWAKRTEKALGERTAWARSLQAELERERERVQERQTRVDSLARQLQQAREQRDALRAEYEGVIHSRSWRVTRPMRATTTLLRRVRDNLHFRALSFLSLARRVRRSLLARGVRDTLRRVKRHRGTDAADGQPRAAPAPDPGPLTLPSAESPLASIVIPVHNHSRLTFACLHSISRHAGDTPFEVIVVDDASTDDTPAMLEEVSGIRVLRNDDNAGFVDSCNRGAAQARGEFLVLLNNDTTVTPGWLEALIATFSEHEKAGLVGARLVYPDGRLQEAGGIVFADGSSWNYGRDDDPDRPEYAFLREVDYCSGACIALPRALFDRLGGFDARYRPAYFEDTDLAMRVREAGRRVLYQPACTIVHHEGASGGTDLSTGTKRYQVVNERKFRERWSEVLRRHPPPGTDPYLARQHRLRGRVLIVDALVPQPDQDSGSLRMTNLMRLLGSLGYGVTFLPANLTALQPYTARLQQMGVEVLHLPRVSSPPQWLMGHGAHFDAAILCRHYVATNFLRLVRNQCPRARVLFDTVDLHYLRERRHAELEGSDVLRRGAERTRREELGVARGADVTLVVSPYEKEALRREAPQVKVAVLSNIHEVRGRKRDFAGRRDIWFVGGFQHPPNVDAMRWFCTDVLPLVKARLPELAFHIVGSKMPPEIERLQGDGVEVHGFVPDVTPFLDGCRLAVAPLRYGAGVKGKVNMSMAHGQPVVATPTAVEGMYITPGREALVAEDAESFAQAVVRAYEDEALWLDLSEHGLVNVRRYFSFDAARRTLESLLKPTAERRPGVSTAS